MSEPEVAGPQTVGGPTNRWHGLEPTEKARRALDRLRETFAVEALPDGLLALAGSEPGVNDVYMNLKRVLEAGKAERGDKFLVAVAVVSVGGAAGATRFLGAAAQKAGLSAQQVLDAVSVGAVGSIFNNYYKFRDLAEHGEFEAFKAPFNANTFLKTSLSPLQTEMINIVVSGLNGCTACVRGHIKKARAMGLTDEQIDELVKVGAVASAFARVTSALEDARASTV